MKKEAAKLIEEYALAAKEAKAKKEKEKLKAELNEKLVAMGEQPLADLTEAQRIAKKNREDAEECIPGTGTSAHPQAIINALGVDERPRPEFAGTVQEQWALGRAWFVRYDENGRVVGSWQKV